MRLGRCAESTSAKRAWFRSARRSCRVHPYIISPPRRYLAQPTLQPTTGKHRRSSGVSVLPQRGPAHVPSRVLPEAAVQPCQISLSLSRSDRLLLHECGIPLHGISHRRPVIPPVRLDLGGLGKGSPRGGICYAAQALSAIKPLSSRLPS